MKANQLRFAFGIVALTLPYGKLQQGTKKAALLTYMSGRFQNPASPLSKKKNGWNSRLAPPS
jgi:hypothetical protein